MGGTLCLQFKEYGFDPVLRPRGSPSLTIAGHRRLQYSRMCSDEVWQLQVELYFMLYIKRLYGFALCSTPATT